MMQLKTLDTNAELTVSEDCFGATFRPALVHQAVTAYATRGRSGTSAQKSRGQVRGGGRKPWRQKGTGRARAGSNRSPIWRGGGVIHPASDRVYDVKLNKKMYRQALRCVFSELLRCERLHVVESFTLNEPKTRLAREKFENLGLTHVLVLVKEQEENLYLAVRNLTQHDICEVDAVSMPMLLGYDHVLLTREALESLEKRLGAEVGSS